VGQLPHDLEAVLQVDAQRELVFFAHAEHDGASGAQYMRQQLAAEALTLVGSTRPKACDVEDVAVISHEDVRLQILRVFYKPAESCVYLCTEGVFAQVFFEELVLELGQRVGIQCGDSSHACMVHQGMPFPQIEATEELVNEEVEAFNKYFQEELKLEPLISFEKAVLKTYLLWKTRTEKSNAP
jgi:hypothetical protein